MTGPFPDVTAFVLAGGKSSRMGTDKTFVTLGGSHLDGRTLLARALDLARSITPEVHIVGDADKFAAFAPTVADIFPNCGPLGGIHAALLSSHTDLNLILAVDVPFVSPTMLQYLIECARNSAFMIQFLEDFYAFPVQGMCLWVVPLFPRQASQIRHCACNTPAISEFAKDCQRLFVQRPRSD